VALRRAGDRRKGPETLEEVAEHAHQLAAAEARTTLMARDVQAGSEAFLRATGPALS